MINKTYQLGLLQAKAYRILRERTKAELKAFDINDIDWSILGLLNDNGEQTSKELAIALSVKIPFITKTCQLLESKDLIRKANHDWDKRSFYFLLSESGKKLVKKVEPELRSKLSNLITPIAPKQIHGYIKTLEKITINDSELKTNDQ